ncbi:replication initiation factor domain-containing protein [Streptococcus suis]|uniref:replication initiation factor domain-containing protein n=1 Tax=Streptococcus suis TaxID=1307 RepID=UPI001ABE73A6|nr:replication initiation factor domain-containing protein [Streptococcus suis]
MTNTVKIDWFSVTIKSKSNREIDFVTKIIQDILVLELSQFSLNDFGLNRYNHHYSLGDINVYFSLDKHGKLFKEMGANIQMTGKGCRQYEEYLQGNEKNWISLIDRVLVAGGRFTRLDVANDLYEDLLNIQIIHSYCRSGLCISNAKSFEYHEKGVLDSGEIVGETINIGSKGSSGQQLGIYNKMMEQLSKGRLDRRVETWIRVELRLFGGTSKNFK